MAVTLILLLLFAPGRAETGARYLVICPDTMLVSIGPLASWKHATGMMAKVVPLSVVGNDTGSIRSFIRNAYYNWPVPPEYVLLVGDGATLAAGIYRDGEYFGSDNLYGDVTGDLRAELPVGRLPARSAAELDVMVAKTLAYERYPDLTDSLWMRRLTTIIREDGDPDDTIYWGNARYAARLAEESGFVGCDSLSYLRGDNRADVLTSVNNGTGIVLYRGQACGNWWSPFDVRPESTRNGAMLPIICSFTCGTMSLLPGEREVGDVWMNTGAVGDLRGAAAFFGNSHCQAGVARYRSALTRGFFDGLFTEGIRALGSAMLRAKAQLRQEYPQDTSGYRGFGIYGDPDLSVWTATPKRLTVEHDSTIPMAACQFDVVVRSEGTPVSGAIVCVSMDSAVYACDTTNGFGQATLDINPTHAGTMSVVVTGRNLRPYVGECEVIAKDVACNSITAPASIVDSGSTVVPACQVYNYGNRTETYSVKMRIGSGYEDSAVVTNHQPNTSRSVSFRDWTAPTRGQFSVSCSTRLAFDYEPGNDRMIGTLLVRVRDAGTTAIVAPVGVYPAGSVVAPRATWHNYGNTEATFRAYVLLENAAAGRSYLRQLVIVGLGPDSDTCPDEFSPCTLDVGGKWTVRCSTYLPYDVKPDNDVMAGSFVVGPTWPAGWTVAAPVPLGQSGKGVKDGGWLTVDGEYGFVYAGKGSKTGEVYRYDAAADSWQPCAPIPDGLEGKKPGKGAAGAADGAGHIYLTKGNSTWGFWMYDAGANSWTQKRNVPVGLSNKKVKGGTDIVWAYKAGNGYAYLLKGYRNEFYGYDPANDSWYTLTPAPVGASVKWDKGSWLAYDGDRTIYAHKAKYHEFYAYNTETGLWYDTLAAMPISGSAGSKKSKDGGCGSWQNGAIYALKGGGTQEFWRYQVPSGSWTELANVPLGNDKKKVKAGADIVSYGYGVFFALKGNKTNEFWRYVATPAQGPQSLAGNSGQASASFGARHRSFVISPNPLAAGFATIRSSSLLRTPFSVRIYDAFGRLVRSSFGIWTSSFRLDLRSMPAGVYLVKFTADDFSATQKFVVQR